MATKAKISQAAVKNRLGGHTSKRRLAYRTPHGATVYLQSSYEIQVAAALDEAGVAWTRPAPLSWTDSTGVEHRYYPDFHLPGYGVYLDPKNLYLQQKDQLKIAAVCEQCGVIILVLGLNELTWQAIFAKISPP